jgi:gas vesicle protein
MRDRLQVLVCGIAVGAVVGLLYAPKSGARTRKMIALKTEEGKMFLKDQREEMREHVADAVERGRDALRKTVEAFAG